MSNTALGAMKSLEFAGKEHENSESKINECKVYSHFSAKKFPLNTRFRGNFHALY